MNAATPLTHRSLRRSTARGIVNQIPGFVGVHLEDRPDMRAVVIRVLAGAAIGIAGCHLAAAAAPAMPAQFALQVKAGVDAWTNGDYPTAVKAWQGPAAKGDADALFNMGQAYKLGRGVPKDLTKAEEYYSKAARLGHVRASDNYGILLFQSGRQKEALPWLEAGADRGEPRAMYVLGVAAFNGDFAPKDWVRAYALMTRAAGAGLAQAVTSLATMNETIPLAQRQMGASLATDLERKAEEQRARQLAAADLGTPAPPPPAPRASASPLATVDLPPASVGATQDTEPSTQPAVAALPPPRKVSPPKPVPPKPVPPKLAPQIAATPAASTSGGNWRIQLGAFGQKANADGLWAKVKNRPELAGHPRIDLGSPVTRLLAGGFTQSTAERACGALKAGGFACLLVAP